MPIPGFPKLLGCTVSIPKPINGGEIDAAHHLLAVVIGELMVDPNPLYSVLGTALKQLVAPNKNAVEERDEDVIVHFAGVPSTNHEFALEQLFDESIHRSPDSSKNVLVFKPEPKGKSTQADYVIRCDGPAGPFDVDLFLNWPPEK